MPTTDYRNAAGERLKGTTTIISANLGWNKNQLMWWAWNEGKEGRNFRDTSEKAADAGTVAHYLIECDIKGREPDTSKTPPDILEKAETGFLNFLEWKRMVNFRPLYTEEHLVSEEAQYGSTPDCIGVVIEKLAVVDWKTSKGIYPDHVIQLASYGKAWNETHPDEPIEGGYHLLRVDKETASFHHHHWQDLSLAWQAFEHLLALDRLQKPLKGLT